MKDIYESCPKFTNEHYLLRLVAYEDMEDLLKVYSDPAAVPLFNSDNCNGDDFHYTTRERMRKAIDFWLWEYGNRMYVRLSIIDRCTQCAIGTTELFVRTAADYFTNCLLLRLDLRSDYEKVTGHGEMEYGDYFVKEN